MCNERSISIVACKNRGDIAPEQAWWRLAATCALAMLQRRMDAGECAGSMRVASAGREPAEAGRTDICVGKRAAGKGDADVVKGEGS